MEMSSILICLLVIRLSVSGTTSEMLSKTFTKLTSEFTEFTSLNVSYDGASQISCATRCMELQDQCYSFIFEKKNGFCDLGSKVVRSVLPRDMGVNIFRWEYDTTDPACTEEELNDEGVYTRNSQCKPSPDTCRDVVSNYARVVVILSSGLEVMCDTETDGGGWTIFQRRVNGQLDFYRVWEEYKYGFGNYSDGEFYLGNENIYDITSQRQHELRIDLGFHNSTYFAKYSSFILLPESEGYMLDISGYSGNAGDSLVYHNNSNFSTFDADYTSTLSCASQSAGAWWYRACLQSNLNSVWGSQYEDGVVWITLTGHKEVATSTEMKFREI